MGIVLEYIGYVFFAIVMFGAVIGVIAIGALSLIGSVKYLFTKNYSFAVGCMALFIFVYSGSTFTVQQLKEESTDATISYAEKESFINQTVFPDERIAIERRDSRIGEDGVSFYVMRESDKNIFYVDIYNEKAFGLYRYKVEPFNEDERQKDDSAASNHEKTQKETPAHKPNV